MIYWELFYVFFKVGLFSFGGGFPTLPLMEKELVIHHLVDPNQFWNITALCQLIPGPSISTISAYIGLQKAGFLGGLVSTLASLLSTVLIVILVYKVFGKIKDHFITQGFFTAIIPITIALILYAGISLSHDSFILNGQFSFKSCGLLIFAFILRYYFQCKAFYLLVILGILGVVFY